MQGGLASPNETKMAEDLVLTNVSALLQQLGEQIDARERQLVKKTESQYKRNEELVNNTIMNLFTSIVVLIKEVVKRSLYHTLRLTSKQLQQLFDMDLGPRTAPVAFVTQGTQEQEDKQNEVTVTILTHTQKAWKEALQATQAPDASVETILMNQAQSAFKQLDCHRRVLVVALQTFQTNHLQAEVQFIETIYGIKTANVNALWQRLQLLLQEYKQQQEQLVTTTQRAIQALTLKHNQAQKVWDANAARFQARLKKLWAAYKANTQMVDDTSSEANNIRVALDVLLQSPGLADYVQATELLQQHWKAVADHVEGCLGSSSSQSKPNTNNSKKTQVKLAIQKNADKMLFCAKSRARVLQNQKTYKSTEQWVQALKKWDNAMRQLEVEAKALALALQSATGTGAEVTEPLLCDNHSMIVAHRQWKRLVFALAPMAAKLKKQQSTLEQQKSAMYAVLLNKVGYELKRGLDSALNKAKQIEETHLDAEKAKVELEETNFKALSEKYELDSRYMDAELQGYGSTANQCRELVTKLFKLKTWEEHAKHLKSELQKLQPLVVAVSKTVDI